jgi:hypothetical protein
MIKRYKASNQRRADNVLINRKRENKTRTMIKRYKASNQRRTDNVLINRKRIKKTRNIDQTLQSFKSKKGRQYIKDKQ